jgi:hypothetical protein
MAGMRSFFSVASLSMGSLRGNLGFNEETPIRTATCGVGKTLDERLSFEFEVQILNQAEKYFIFERKKEKLCYIPH